MMRGRLALAALFVGIAACASILGIGEGHFVPLEESGADDGGLEAGNDVTDAGVSSDSAVDVPTVYHPLSRTYWTTFNLSPLGIGLGFSGGAFDGRYVYFTQPSGKYILRYDIQVNFTDPSSWTSYDLSTANSAAKEYQGAVYDGQYLYLVPDTSGLVARYSTRQVFTDSTSWAFFDMTLRDSKASGYRGGTFDGRFVYFAPYSGAGGTSWRAMRYDTQADFHDAGAWGDFGVSGLSAEYLMGAIYDGRYVTFAPGSASVARSVRVDTHGDFADATAWESYATSNAANVAGAYDGRFVYFSPYVDIDGAAAAAVTRFDTGSLFESDASWSMFDIASVDASARGYAGAAFDGRRVTFVPYGLAGGTTHGIVAQYDISGAFEDGGGWSLYDLAELEAGCRAYRGAIFDGRYLYLVPNVTNVVARFDAREPRSPPPSGGSFF
jgi:hypothetical protein